MFCHPSLFPLTLAHSVHPHTAHTYGIMVGADAIVYLTSWLVPVYKKTLHWQPVFHQLITRRLSLDCDYQPMHFLLFYGESVVLCKTSGKEDRAKKRLPCARLRAPSGERSEPTTDNGRLTTDRKEWASYAHWLRRWSIPARPKDKT